MPGNSQYEYSYNVGLLMTELLFNRSYNSKVPPTSMRDMKNGEGLLAKGTDVQVQLKIFKVESLDQSAGHLKLKVWFRMYWSDLRLSWDPADFNGIEETQLNDKGDVWLPDVQPYNSLEQISSTFDNTLVRLKHTGELMWSRPGLLALMCKFSGMVDFPFDTLSCLTEFGGWTMGGTIQGVMHKGIPGTPGFCPQPGDDHTTTEATQGSSYQEFSIDRVECTNATYDYGEIGSADPWPVVRYRFRLKRASAYYIPGYVVLPVMLTASSFLVFWMDPGVGERLGFGITLVLTVFFIQIGTADMLPICGEYTWIHIFNLVQLIYTTLALIETTVVLGLFFTKSQHVLPIWLVQAYRRCQARHSPHPQTLLAAALSSHGHLFHPRPLLLLVPDHPRRPHRPHPAALTALTPPPSPPSPATPAPRRPARPI